MILTCDSSSPTCSSRSTARPTADELAAADQVADGIEQTEAVLTREITIAGRGQTQRPITRLQPTSTRPRRNGGSLDPLARLYEADAKPAEAIVACTKGTAVDQNRCRLVDAGPAPGGVGQPRRAADASRTLAGLDRKNPRRLFSRQSPARARLGRRDGGPEGRSRVAAGPRERGAAQEFADCASLSAAADEGLEALRRGARAIRRPEGIEHAGDALAKQFRTEEAIELTGVRLNEQ